MAIASVLHTEGPQFEPGSTHFFHTGLSSRSPVACLRCALTSTDKDNFVLFISLTALRDEIKDLLYMKLDED